jgi:hypothetical protein
MKGEVIPDSDHVAHYCGGSTIQEDGDISAAAFMLRRNEEYLSVNWLECLAIADRSAQIRNLQGVYASKLQVGAAARITVLSVGSLRAKVQQESPDQRTLSVQHEPEENDPSHSGIFGFTQDDEIVAELLAQAVLEKYPARA